ncbi:fatty acid desaturase family protein [Planctomycetaceae bacterium SH139]
MRTVDEILKDHDAGLTPAGAECQLPLERFSRRRHIDTVRALSQVNGWRTSSYLLLHWGVIAVTMVIVAVTMHWAAFLLGGLVIASRMQALGVMLHDATHYLLYRNRVVNDVISDLLIAFPLGMGTTLYRKTHFRHHRFTNTEEDQDLVAQRQEREWYEWPKTRWGCALAIVRSVLGVNAHRAWILFKHWAPWNHLRDPLSVDFPLRARMLYVATTSLVYVLFGWAVWHYPGVVLPLVALYMVSGFTLLNLINRIRATAEHLGVPGTHELNATRTVLPNWWERIFIAPYGVSYHLEHHLFPSVPGCNLPKLHRVLMQDAEFATQAHLTKTYVGLFRELMTPAKQSPAASPVASSSASPAIVESQRGS